MRRYQGGVFSTHGTPSSLTLVSSAGDMGTFYDNILSDISDARQNKSSQAVAAMGVSGSPGSKFCYQKFHGAGVSYRSYAIRAVRQTGIISA